VTDAVPLLPPKQLTSVFEVVPERTVPGWLITADAVAVQLLASETVTV
jgi:hypothetical protein